jgi:choline dehydrogenase-like flavoprotein
MMELYKANRTGPYTTATGDFLGFLPAQKFSPRYASIAQAAREQDPKAYLAKDSPQSFIDGYKKELSLLADGVASDEQAVLEIIWSGGTFVLGLMHPFTRGTVRLASKDPFDAPLADSMFLHNPLDVELMIDAVKYARTITQTDPMQAFNPVEIMPGANVSSDAEIAQAVRENLSTLFHPSCTCRAGKFEDGAVVDEQFRLYGVKNLRVADASVMPMLPASHVQSTVYALGEKVSCSSTRLITGV